MWKGNQDASAEPMSDQVKPQGWPDWEEIDSAGAIVAPIQTFIDFVGELPGKSSAMLQPIADAASDLLESVSALEEAAAGILSVAAPNLATPSPPEAVGIFGSQGITLGTHDRIVGQGGHGILFVVDGQSGEADKGRRVAPSKAESIANLAGGFADYPTRATNKPSLGFRVMSDTSVDLAGAEFVQMIAMGRGEAKKDRPHGDKIGGIGVARVLSSWVTEVAAFEKVIISARSAGDSSDTEALTGGRIEMAGQTIAIGGVRNEEKDTAGDPYGPWDFDEERKDLEAHSKSFGIAAIGMKEVPMANHLTLQAKKAKKDKVTGRVIRNAITNKAEKKPHKHLAAGKKYAWPEKLRREHPVTERIHLHSSKEVVIVVGKYMVSIDEKKGISVGARKAEKDPSKNLLNPEMTTLGVEDVGFLVEVPNDGGNKDGTQIGALENSVFLVGTDGSGKAAKLNLAEGSAEVEAGSSDSIKVTSQGTKIATQKYDVNASGTVKIKGSNVSIG